MKGLGGLVGRVDIELADHLTQAQGGGYLEQVTVEQGAQPARTCPGGDDDAVDVEKVLFAAIEPLVVDAVLGRARGKRQ